MCYEVGDFVELKEGFNSNRDDENYGGAGYDKLPKNKKIKITYIVGDGDQGTAYYFENETTQNGVLEHTIKSKAEIRDEKLTKLLKNN